MILFYLFCVQIHVSFKPVKMVEHVYLLMAVRPVIVKKASLDGTALLVSHPETSHIKWLQDLSSMYLLENIRYFGPI